MYTGIWFSFPAHQVLPVTSSRITGCLIHHYDIPYNNVSDQGTHFIKINKTMDAMGSTGLTMSLITQKKLALWLMAQLRDILWQGWSAILGMRSEGWGGQKVWPCRALPSLEGLEKKSSLIWPKLNKLTLAFMFRTDRRKTGWKQGGQSGVIPITPMGGNGTKLVLLLKRYRENVRRCFSSKHFNTDLLI